jgi:hypothetical protein
MVTKYGYRTILGDGCDFKFPQLATHDMGASEAQKKEEDEFHSMEVHSKNTWIQTYLQPFV